MSEGKIRRSVAVLGLLAAPIVVGATLGAGSANAAPWQVGPVFRAEYSGESGHYMCDKASAMAPSWQMTVLVGCRFDPPARAWYNVVFDPARLAPWTWGS
ncbi:hypothetical protein [Rhodococcus kronopolitis]|uniref:Secreted protein n=1 Tax=Rhodococcus kronopolitis TaxID=1460226 RepID=A0ABV9FN67_9NOCA